jgi:hypothetical protein
MNMSFFQWLILLAFIVAFGYYNRLAFIKAWKRIRKKKADYSYRMLVAVRRRPAGLTHFLALSSQQQTALLQQLDSQWQSLVGQWLAVAPFVGGFLRSEQGLALQSDEEWAAIEFFDIPNFEALAKCQNMLNQSGFLELRSFYDIRLIYGKKQSGQPGPLSALF